MIAVVEWPSISETTREENTIMSTSINNVTLVGNLTRDPETRAAGTTTVCSLRLAVNDRVKDPATGEWGDRANYFDVDVFGSRGDLCD